MQDSGAGGFGVHSRVHPRGHDELGDEHLDDFAKLITGLSADGSIDPIR